MGNIITSKIFHSVMLFTVVGEFFLPWILCRYYDGYNSKTMAMSALGSLQSPVRVIYNTWLIWLGCFLAFAAAAYFFTTKKDFPILSVLLLFSLGTFAVGAGLVSGIFHVNENKDIVTAASKVHGISAAIGFMALIFFVCFIMGDKEQFQNTVLKYEGLWERLSLLCMYIPLAYKAVHNLLS